MTDNEIIKAYGCCNLSHDECGGCDNCPCKIEGECIVPSGFELEREIFNLLNRQQAEIERLTAEADMADGYEDALCERVRTEAVKEFAERLKEYVESYDVTTGYKITIVNAVEEETIDNLVKEMVGEVDE